MRYVLSQASRPLLERLAAEPTLCAFDFDGTLAPIADHPDAAVMRESTRSRLAEVAALYPCIILSGRARADVAAKMDGVSVCRILGSHGAENERSAHNGRPQVCHWKTVLETALAAAPGIWVEDKGHSLAVHYRHALHKDDALNRILHAAQPLEQARIFGGKYVVNLTVEGDPHKGTALAAERDRLGCTWVLYAGDDDNDEDAFAIGGNLVGVRIGLSAHSRAKYFLRSQKEIEALLEALIALRRAAPQAPASNRPRASPTDNSPAPHLPCSS